MSRILLAAHRSGVGVSAVCLRLVRAMHERGVDVGFYKPLTQPRGQRHGADRSAEPIRLTAHLASGPIPAEQVKRR